MLNQSTSNSFYLAVARFKVLQEVVTIVRTARERRHIRNNLPIKNVLIVSSIVADIEAVTYLKSYVLSEVNAWDITTSTEWSQMCLLKIVSAFPSL